MKLPGAAFSISKFPFYVLTRSRIDPIVAVLAVVTMRNVRKSGLTPKMTPGITHTGAITDFVNYQEFPLMICPYCKETILDGAIKCRHCGSMLNLEPSCGVNTDSITTDEIRAFVGTNAHYYIQNFSKFTQSGTEKFCLTWNWSTCGFTFIWMLYRKMYVQALFTFVVFCIPGINILLHIFVGVAGNYLYYRHVKEKILEIRAIQSPQGIFPVLQETGGVHQWVITAGVVISVILALLIFFFFAAITAFIGNSLPITI